tara:strand:+ start:204 stop:590 length:387 start_codon:yes stop_codon:yes gene_type:complete
MNIKVPISLGELIDKISILEIKKNKISNKEKNQHITQELIELNKVLKTENIDQKKINFFLAELKEINLKLWNIEDQIRICEKKSSFKEDFINLARSVYKFNDIRAKIKLKINTEFNSTLVEIKSYEEY